MTDFEKRKQEILDKIFKDVVREVVLYKDPNSGGSFPVFGKEVFDRASKLLDQLYMEELEKHKRVYGFDENADDEYAVPLEAIKELLGGIEGKQE